MLCEQCNQQTAWRCEKSKGRECGCVPGAAPKRRQIWLEIVVGGVSQVGSWLAAYLQCPASAEMAGLWCTHEKHAQGGSSCCAKPRPLGAFWSRNQADTFLKALQATLSMRRTMALICWPGPSSCSWFLPVQQETVGGWWWASG